MTSKIYFFQWNGTKSRIFLLNITPHIVHHFPFNLLNRLDFTRLHFIDFFVYSTTLPFNLTSLNSSAFFCKFSLWCCSYKKYCFRFFFLIFVFPSLLLSLPYSRFLSIQRCYSLCIFSQNFIVFLPECSIDIASLFCAGEQCVPPPL